MEETKAETVSSPVLNRLCGVECYQSCVVLCITFPVGWCFDPPQHSIPMLPQSIKLLGAQRTDSKVIVVWCEVVHTCHPQNLIANTGNNSCCMARTPAVNASACCWLENRQFKLANIYLGNKPHPQKKNPDINVFHALSINSTWRPQELQDVVSTQDFEAYSRATTNKARHD